MISEIDVNGFKINAHNFKCCDTHGGQAFRHWCMLYKYRGIFIGFDNHSWVEFASTDPDAKWTLGCQDSCAYGDPYPSSVAKLVSISCLPVSAQVTAKRWIEEAKAICVEKIKNHEEQKENERKEKELEADKEYQKKVAEKWAKK